MGSPWSILGAASLGLSAALMAAPAGAKAQAWPPAPDFSDAVSLMGKDAPAKAAASAADHADPAEPDSPAASLVHDDFPRFSEPSDMGVLISDAGIDRPAPATEPALEYEQAADADKAAPESEPESEPESVPESEPESEPGSSPESGPARLAAAEPAAAPQAALEAQAELAAAPAMPSAQAFAVQVAAYQSVEDAADARRRLASQETALASLQALAERVERDGAKPLYRLKFGPYGDKPSADKACAALKASGRDCFVRPFTGDPLS